MPNTGRPSQDCHLCRQRRVKCDLGRPGCQRCFKYGSVCPGYREQHDLVFRNANPTTLGKKRAKRAPAKEDEDGYKSSPADSSTRSNSPASFSSNGGTLLTFDSQVHLPGERATLTALTTISRPLSEHWTTHSVPILLNVYSALDFLHNIYRINSRNGPLLWAAHLFTRTYVTNIRYPVSIYKESEAETKRELGTYLGKTLSAVNAALKEPDGAFRDDVLATVWILANYELLVGSLSRMEPLSPWHLHARGLYSMLKARGTEYLLTEQGRVAFWPCYNMVQIQALVSNTECPPESEEWLGLIRETLGDGEGFTLHVSVFVTTCTHVQAAILGMLRRRDFRAADEQYESLIAKLVTAEKEFNSYVKTAADCSHDMDVYMRNLYCSAIIKGYTYIMLLTNFLTHYASSRITLGQLQTQRARCLDMVRAAAQSIVDSVPVALGPLAAGKDKSPRVLFDALKMVWPLTAVYIVDGTLPEQKSEAEVALIFIGKEVGVRQALNTYPGKLPLPLEARQPLGFKPEDDAGPFYTPSS